MNGEWVKFLKEKLFPRFLIALLLTLLAIFLNSSPLLNFVTSLIPQLNYFLTIIFSVFFVIAISCLLASISPLFKKVLVSPLEKFQKASTIKSVVLAIFEDLLSGLSYLLGFLAGALADPKARSYSVVGIILVLAIFFVVFLFSSSLLGPKTLCVFFRKLDEKVIHTGENSAS
jgi:hypothetical protein